LNGIGKKLAKSLFPQNYDLGIKLLVLYLLSGRNREKTGKSSVITAGKFRHTRKQPGKSFGTGKEPYKSFVGFYY